MFRPDSTAGFARRIVFLAKDIREEFHDLLAVHGCTIPTWAVLNHAHQTSRLSQVQLAAQIGIEGPTLARHLDRLCAEGLVERHRDAQDRRVVRIMLTPAGERRWAELADVSDDLERRLTRSLTNDHRAALDAALELIHLSLEDVHAPADANR